MRRALRFCFSENEKDFEIDLDRVTMIDIPDRRFYLEEMKNGKFRLTLSKRLLVDISDLQAITFVRDD